MLRPCVSLLLPLLLVSLACDVREPPVQPQSRPTTTTTTTTTTSVTRPPNTGRRIALLDDPTQPTKNRGPALTWTARVAIAVADLQARQPALYKQLATLRPDHRVGDELSFNQPVLADPRAAAVLLQRLLAGDDPVDVRLAVVDALPNTGGDWQEGAAALVAIDASPRVRKKLVETLRYVAPPHNLAGLRLALADEDLAVRVAAARTAGFTRDGTTLFTELVSATFDEDWDMRAAAVQALGQLTGPRGARNNPARDRLVRMLTDPRPEVRLQVLLALERIDPAGLRQLPDLERLARDGKSPQVAEIATRLLRERPPKTGTAQPATGGGGLVSAP